MPSAGIVGSFRARDRASAGRLSHAYAEEMEVPPDWNIDFTSALTRLLTATCAGLIAQSS